MYHLQYLCAYQPIFRDVDEPYWSWEAVARDALSLLQSGRKVVRISDQYGQVVAEYDQSRAGQLMGQAGTTPSNPGLVGWA